MNIKILDCTLRDGGYINDWKFSEYYSTKILESLNKSNIDIIECGYLNDKIGKVDNSTLFNSTGSVDKLLKKISFNKNIKKVIMINLGDFDISNLLPKSKTLIEGIRLAFHKKDLDEAFKIAYKIKELGYKIFFQPMVTKNYKDIEFLYLIERVNKLNPYSFYIVDSFGSMTLDEFHKYLILSDNNVNKSISIGYHSHNNMQLAFSNSVSMCNMKLKRNIIIDSSIYGIGRGAGNLNTELISDFLNKSNNKSYNTLPLLEIIDEFLTLLMKEKPWGFSPAQFLSASYNCHPNYATYLINKNTNYIVGIKKILDNLAENHKSTFNKEIIENLYKEYILKPNSNIKGKLKFNNNNILLLASGKSVNEYQKEIKEKIKKKKYQIIGINHKPYIDCDYYFFTNQKRYDEFYKDIDNKKMIVTNNIKIKSKVSIVLDFSKFVLNYNNNIITNSTLIFINYLIQSKVKNVDIAGLDGYKICEKNYSYDENQIVPDEKEQQSENIVIKNLIKQFVKKIKIKLITPSVFKIKG